MITINGTLVDVRIERYDFDRTLCIVLDNPPDSENYQIDGRQYAMATYCDIYACEERVDMMRKINIVLIKDYSENEGFYQQLVDQKVIADFGNPPYALLYPEYIPRE